jgi:hypothetical protein
MRTITTHHRRQSNPRSSTHLAKIQYWGMQLILEKWWSNSILVRTNQLQNLFYKFNFTIFIYNSSTNKICMHGTEFRFHTALQLLFSVAFALFWMQFILVGQSKHFWNCLTSTSGEWSIHQPPWRRQMQSSKQWKPTASCNEWSP